MGGRCRPYGTSGFFPDDIYKQVVPTELPGPIAGVFQLQRSELFIAPGYKRNPAPEERHATTHRNNGDGVGVIHAANGGAIRGWFGYRRT
jgi:hypothetical protein